MTSRTDDRKFKRVTRRELLKLPQEVESRGCGDSNRTAWAWTPART